MTNTAAKLQPAPATLAFFPLASRRQLVRKAARELNNLHGEEANTYWRTTCKKLGAELLDLGCPAEAMREEIIEFQEAVQMELMWLHREAARV
ncbi:DUF6074 family protein [Allorhizobium undicola]|uniref:DUF6074 family protein n=1 Tax=Allorhizobium undicola TaxID=78527 RepID=UPI003D340610